MTSPIYPVAWCRAHLIPELKQKENSISGADYAPVIEFQPLEVKGEKNAFVDADICEVRLDYEDFPFDPRIVRGGLLEVYIDDAGRVVDAGQHFAELLQLGPQVPARAIASRALRDRCAFIGVIDEIQSEILEEGRKTVLKARDYTAYFIDVPPESKELSWSKEGRKRTLIEILEDLVAQRKTTRAITVVPVARDPDALVALTELAPADYKLRATDEATGKRKRKSSESIWDLIQELALEAGLVAYIDKDELIVREPRTLHSEEFTDAQLIRFTLGLDVAEYSPTRLLGRQHGIGITVRAFNPDTQEILEWSILDDGTRGHLAELAADPEREGEQKIETTPYVVRVSTQAQVEKIADAIWTQLRPHEIEGSIVTREMSDTGGLHFFAEMEYGDPIVVDVSEDMRSIAATRAAEQLDRLVRSGMDPVTADALTAAQDNLTVPFYLDKIQYRISDDPDNAWEMDLRFRGRKQVNLHPITARGPSVEITLED